MKLQINKHNKSGIHNETYIIELHMEKYKNVSPFASFRQDLRQSQTETAKMKSLLLINKKKLVYNQS